MNIAVPVAMFLIGSTLYLLAAVRWPQHVPLPLLGALLERLPAPPELRLPRVRRPRLVKQGRHHADRLTVELRRPEFRETGPLQITGGRPYVREMTRYLP